MGTQPKIIEERSSGHWQK